MSALPFAKFFWADYSEDPALKLCGFAAQGLWMRMLCIAAQHDPIGYVAVAGRGLDIPAIARMTGGRDDEVEALLQELDRNGVFSRDRHGRIYSRRMVRDAKKAAVARKNGRKGGNPSLSKQSSFFASDNPLVNPEVKPQKPAARVQSPDSTSHPPTAPPRAHEAGPGEAAHYFNEVCAAAGWSPRSDDARIEALSVINGWLAYGYDLRLDILAGIRRARAKRPGKTTTLKRFTSTIAGIHSDRGGPPPKPNGARSPEPEISPEERALVGESLRQLAARMSVAG